MSLQQQWSSTSLANRCRSWCWHYLHVWNSYHPCNRHTVLFATEVVIKIIIFTIKDNTISYLLFPTIIISSAQNRPPSPWPNCKTCINGLFDRLTYDRHLPLGEERRSLRACYWNPVQVWRGRWGWADDRPRCFSLPAMGHEHMYWKHQRSFS